jgi:hypothetical protein
MLSSFSRNCEMAIAFHHEVRFGASAVYNKPTGFQETTVTDLEKE